MGEALKLQRRSGGFVVDRCVNVQHLEEPNKDFEGDAADMTPDKCFSFCGAHKTTFFGISKGNKCWCAMGYQEYQGAGPAKCDVPCAGDADQKCGGQDSTSIWIMTDCD